LVRLFLLKNPKQKKKQFNLQIRHFKKNKA
jgi:hypothetical protein